MKKSSLVKISVCIPVYNTERWLWQCLESIAAQSFKNVEIIVLSDASPGKDDKGLTAKKIVKKFKKSYKLPVRFIENYKNCGLIEVRRTLVTEARGEYVYMLDSDDFLPQDALKKLYETALLNNADVVQGDCVTLDSSGKNHIECQNEFHSYKGTFLNSDVFEACFFKGLYRPVLAGKLIKTGIYQKAYENIPYIYVHMAEEVIQYFFIARLAKCYVGIQEPVYFYRQGTGITTKQITSLNDWKKVCSTASIITALYSWVEAQNLTQESEEFKSIQRLAKFYCINNVQQLRNKVSKELYDDAYQMLCDYWGNESIKNTEAFLDK